MIQANSILENELQKIALHLKGNERLIKLFQTLPNATLDVYHISAEYYANKIYDEINNANKILPHGFYDLLEQDLKALGMTKTFTKYEREINLISKTMDIPLIDLKKIIMTSKQKERESIIDKEKRQKAQADLKEIIRKCTSKYKETLLKKIIATKEKKLNKYVTAIESDSKKRLLPLDTYIKDLLSSEINKNSIIARITKRFPELNIDDDKLKDLIYAVFKPNYQEEIERVLGLNITEPPKYKYFTSNKNKNRLKNNYESKINNIFNNRTSEEKELFVRAVNYLTASKRINASIESPEYQEIKKHIPHYNQVLAEEISVIMSQCEGSKLTLDNNQLIFNFAIELTPTEWQECSKYTKYLKGIKAIHNTIQESYEIYNKSFRGILDNTPKYSKENASNYIIDITPWYQSEKIIRLLGRINLYNIFKLSDYNFEILRQLLIEKGLLWAYISDNIDISTIAKIINSFDKIVNLCEIDHLTKNNLSEIIRNANLFGFADEIIIGLIGLDNLSKIISYNQFSGIKVTDEVIESRLKKVVDLSVRSERLNYSSLPFDCNVKLGNYTLSRYQNNDPSIFTCGIDTKTCFFVSVNENDFFFYSLLSKDGYVIKIMNEKQELIARASCFRKNNVLMINGIRCKNNKVLPENQEETKEMIQIVELIKLAADKMINMTTNDDCPIDYVVCNKAGILENAIFENKFEIINPILFREPVNVYGDEWQQFVHLYDDEEEQMLQEVPNNPEHSFTTDFGEHYPALLISSRDWRALMSPRDISYNDQSATYRRPRKSAETYIKDEITPQILERINRIRALACFVGEKDEVEAKRKNYHLITNTKDIKSITIGEDWVVISANDDTMEVIYANKNQIARTEACKYLRRIDVDDDGVRLYYRPTKKDS